MIRTLPTPDGPQIRINLFALLALSFLNIERFRKRIFRAELRYNQRAPLVRKKSSIQLIWLATRNNKKSFKNGVKLLKVCPKRYLFIPQQPIYCIIRTYSKRVRPDDEPNKISEGPPCDRIPNNSAGIFPEE